MARTSISAYSVGFYRGKHGQAREDLPRATGADSPGRRRDRAHRDISAAGAHPSAPIEGRSSHRRSHPRVPMGSLPSGRGFHRIGDSHIPCAAEGYSVPNYLEKLPLPFDDSSDECSLPRFVTDEALGSQLLERAPDRSAIYPQLLGDPSQDQSLPMAEVPGQNALAQRHRSFLRQRTRLEPTERAHSLPEAAGRQERKPWWPPGAANRCIGRHRLLLRLNHTRP
jgi:hypothetical protein